MKIKHATLGFSIMEMVITITIITTLGSVGIQGFSEMKKHFSVSSAQDKVESIMKEMKKDVLNGLAPCSKIAFTPENFSSEGNSLFFYTEEWGNFDKKKYYCFDKISRNITNVVQSITLNNKNKYFEIKTNYIVNKSIEARSFDEDLNEIVIKDITSKESDEDSSKGLYIHSFKIPLNESINYSIILNDEGTSAKLSFLKIYFFNANLDKIEKNDPSMLRISKITGETISHAIKNGALDVIHESPYAKSSTFIKEVPDDPERMFLAKNIKIYFISENEAEGDYGFYNANILAVKENQNKNTQEMKACSFAQEPVEFSCY